MRDPATGQDVVLSKEDLELISRIRQGQVPNSEHDEYEVSVAFRTGIFAFVSFTIFDEYARCPARLQPWVEWFSREVLATPLRAFPEHKRSFLPSRDDRRHVARIVHALKMGWTKTRKQLADERRTKKVRPTRDLAGRARGRPLTAVPRRRRRSTTCGARRARRSACAACTSTSPRRSGRRRRTPRATTRRPSTCWTPRRCVPPAAPRAARRSRSPRPLQMKEWNKCAETPWKRKYTFLPTKHAALRVVPAYERFVRERFLRCLDLYLAPRAVKMRLTVRPEELVPRLPAPRDLRPFPAAEALRFAGHTALVRSVDFDPSGQYVVSGGDDGTVRGERRAEAGRERRRPLTADR